MDEVYLKRKIDSYLLSWKKDPNRKPLIVKGSRQVGKTESILHFAMDIYQSVIYINFVEAVSYTHLDVYKRQNELLHGNISKVIVLIASIALTAWEIYFSVRVSGFISLLSFAVCISVCIVMIEGGYLSLIHI